VDGVPADRTGDPQADGGWHWDPAVGGTLWVRVPAGAREVVVAVR
jgi:hypothetical protein